MHQLEHRNASYPIEYCTDPGDTNDANFPWLAPGRLLLFVKYSQPTNDKGNVTGHIDGRPVLVRKAYNTIVRNPDRFIGHWADVTPLVVPETQQTLTLQLAAGSPAVLGGVFFGNVESIFTEALNVN